MLLGYGLVCTLVTAMLHTVAELTIAFPVSGNFVDYADRFIDPAMAFAVGFAEWIGTITCHPSLVAIFRLTHSLGWTAVTAAEAIFFNTLVNYWADGITHQAVWSKFGAHMARQELPLMVTLQSRCFSSSSPSFSFFRTRGSRGSNMSLR
jgi:amino acid permease